MRVVGPSGQPPYNATTCGVSPDSPCLLQDALSQCVGSSAVQVTLQFLHGTYHQDQVTVTGGESTPISITLELVCSHLPIMLLVVSLCVCVCVCVSICVRA